MRRASGLQALLAGGLAVAGFAPFEYFPLTLLSLAWLYRLWQGCERRRAAFALGLLWGLGFFLAGISWLYVALHRFGGMPAPLAALAILLFCALMALYPALTGAAFARLRRRQPLADAGLFAALWCLAELARGWVFTGFPWLSVGYSQTPPSPLAGYLPVVGVFGTGLLLALLAALLAEAVADGRRAWRRLVVVALPVLLLGGGLRLVAWVLPVGEPVAVSLLQTNIAQDEKWRPGLLDDWLELNRTLVAAHPAALTVLPETALPLLADRLPPGYLNELAAPVRARGGDLIVGLFLREADGAIHNAALALGDGPNQIYAKHHLVPFGEYSPPTFAWLMRLLRIPMADQTPGPADQPPLAVAGQRVAVNICYEDVFGGELIHALPEATLMLNISNLAWYGDSFAQPQHLQIARVRALESGRPMLRATNTGMTAVVQPDGVVSAVLPAFQRGALQAMVRGYEGLTPFARWGNGAALALALVLLLVAQLGGRRT